MARVTDTNEENLYRAPQSSVAKTVSGRTDYVYRSPRRLANVVRGMIIGLIVLTLGLVVAQGNQWHVLQQMADKAFASREEMLAAATQSDRIVALLAGLFGILLLATYIPAGMWIYRAACNARALGAQGLDDSPGLAVGSYAIPFVNLVRPFRAMSQIWRASSLPGQWQKKTRVPALLRWWWGFWLLDNFVGYANFRTAKSTGSIESLIQQTQLSMGSELLGIVASCLFLSVVLGLTRLQERQHANPEPASTERDGMDLSWLDTAPAMTAGPKVGA